MASELPDDIGNHDEMDEVVTPCDWCGDPDGDDCRCYVGHDDEEYAR